MAFELGLDITTDDSDVQWGITQGQHVRSGSGTLRRKEKRWEERGEEMGKADEGVKRDTMMIGGK